MSGTSADGIDAVLVNFDPGISIIDTAFLPYPDDVRTQILQFQLNPELSFQSLSRLDIELGNLAARIVNQLRARHPGVSISAVGSHGQTIMHCPNQTPAYTLQIGNGGVIAEQTGITTINNFRVRDIVLGGQGAPFAPLFHREFFSCATQPRVIVNIGGIANLSCLNSDGSVSGFDTGPGNCLMDDICRDKFNQHYDDDGDLAARGSTDEHLLEALCSDAYFSAPPPKSTGQDYFNYRWLAGYLSRHQKGISAIDLLATVTRLTARSIAQAISPFHLRSPGIYLCGGGSKNRTLLTFLRQELNADIKLTDDLGIPADWVEACGFAWLAKRTIENEKVDFGQITGCSRAYIPGCIWPV